MAPAPLLSLLGISLNPLNLAKDIVNDFFSAALSLFGSGASAAVSTVLGFVTKTSDPVFSGGWWSAAGRATFDRVLFVSGSVLALAFMCSIVTAVISADHTLLAKATRRLPIAVIEMALLVGVTSALIYASDELAAAIAHGSTSGLSSFVALDLAGSIAASGIVGLIAGGLVIVAALVIWAELICRTALIYVAVMTGPLVFAASVHPSVNGLKRRYVEGCLALIFSKVVIALAFATGSAMLSGLGASTSASAAIGALLEALAILLVACFSPFVLLRLLVGAEAIIALEGLERRPGRAMMGTAAMASTAGGFSGMLRGFGGTSTPRSGGSAGSPSSGPPRPASPSPGTPSGGSPLRGSGPHGPSAPTSQPPVPQPPTPKAPTSRPASRPTGSAMPGRASRPSTRRPPDDPSRRTR